MKEICEVILKVAELADALKVKPMNQFEGCWEYQINDNWFIAVNGHKQPTKTSKGTEVPPFNGYVEYNGWPAGIFNPFGGGFIAGVDANEDAFIAAIDKVIVEKEANK